MTSHQYFDELELDEALSIANHELADFYSGNK